MDFRPLNFALKSETAAALERRADLRLARLLVRAAREDERIVDAAYYPRLDLTLFGRYIPKTDLRQPGSNSVQNTSNLVSSEILAGPGYTWQVIDNGKVRGASLRQQSVREINELQLRKLETSVSQELAGLQNNFRAIAARHDSLSKAVAGRRKKRGRCRKELAAGTRFAARIPQRRNGLARDSRRRPEGGLRTGNDARRMGSRDRPILSILGRHDRKRA